MWHPSEIEKYPGTLKELAQEIANLRYDSLAQFLLELRNCLEEDSKEEAFISLVQAWRICEPYMKDSEKQKSGGER